VASRPYSWREEGAAAAVVAARVERTAMPTTEGGAECGGRAAVEDTVVVAVDVAVAAREESVAAVGVDVAVVPSTGGGRKHH